MILAAGLGTRLKPFTENKPKALIAIKGRPMLGILIDRLSGMGFTDIIINVHHHARQIMDYLQQWRNFHINIAVSNEKEELLDTGGGLVNASWFFDENPFLLHNVDVMTNLDLHDLFRDHVESGALVTLAVKHRNSRRQLIFDENNKLAGKTNLDTGEKILARNIQEENRYAFSGIHVIDPALFGKLPQKKAFPIMDAYLDLCNSESIRAYREEESYWYDLGTPEKIKEAAKTL